ncbi:SpoIIE family protein phosphatase [Amycolatopsis thermophila]|uniref:Serine phosphatase RsbU (Regulator of sigma subunit) n=1 Tax=Amycolatopsis thermophila TaxID=206084 RepID=A0ABU0EZ52_9PSEU|nr:SpoIIE family protein phosphatase [Amycolatopsis thermophila]MDQ0380598.1 serine phosphatase RsbU (regulator of sigma subunit) [Amycolatopsis thermophila]
MTGRQADHGEAGAHEPPVFGLSDTVRVAAALRAEAEHAPDLATAAQAVVRRLRDGFAAAAELYTVDEDGSPVLVASAGDPPAGAALDGVIGPRPPAERFPVARSAGVLAFGGPLSGGRSFWIALRDPAGLPERTARAIAVSVRAGLLSRGTAAEREEALRDYLAMLEDVARVQGAALERAVDRVGAEAELVDMLQAIGLRLTAQLDIDTLVQEATDAATRGTAAAFGAFFYNLIDEFGESYTLYTLSGIPKETFDGFPMPRNTGVFAPTFNGSGIVRSDDITEDPRYGHNAPHFGMPEGHLPVRSYLAVPVITPTTREVLGGFFFAHPEPGRFTVRHEQIAAGIAGYAAVALDNARMFARHRSMATELARSMLPAVPDIPGLRIVSRYLPAAAGSEVGGDWFDVIQLPGGRTAFVVGDVVGRGVPAAAVMGQMRTAIRSYALVDLPPSDVLHNVSQLARSTPGAKFITCLYAVHDPIDDSLTYANAGHLPAVLIDAGGSTRQIAEALGMPLGVGEQYPQEQVPFPPGMRLVLYTDGLVESRTRELGAGIDELLAGLRALPADGDLDAGCDALIAQLTGGRHDDDVALLYVDHRGAHRRVASMALTRQVDVAAVREFVVGRLAGWGLDEVAEGAAKVAAELVTNALKHASAPLTLRLYHDGERLTVDVADRAGALPHILATGGIEHRGLQVVEEAATRWGTRTTPDGKVVWAELTTG